MTGLLKKYVEARRAEIHQQLVDHDELRESLKWTPNSPFRGSAQGVAAGGADCANEMQPFLDDWAIETVLLRSCVWAQVGGQAYTCLEQDQASQWTGPGQQAAGSRARSCRREQAPASP